MWLAIFLVALFGTVIYLVAQAVNKMNDDDGYDDDDTDGGAAVSGEQGFVVATAAKVQTA